MTAKHQRTMYTWAFMMIALVLSVGVVAAGCNTLKHIGVETKDEVEDLVVALKTVTTIKEESLKIAQQSPEFPLAVIEGMATSNFVITELAEASAKSAAVYEGADAEIKALENLGVPVPQIKYESAKVAARATKRFLIEGLTPAISDLRAIISAAKRKDFTEVDGLTSEFNKGYALEAFMKEGE